MGHDKVSYHNIFFVVVIAYRKKKKSEGVHDLQIIENIVAGIVETDIVQKDAAEAPIDEEAEARVEDAVVVQIGTEEAQRVGGRVQKDGEEAQRDDEIGLLIVKRTVMKENYLRLINVMIEWQIQDVLRLPLVLLPLLINLWI